VQEGNTRWYNERRKNSRLQKVAAARKAELKKARADASRLRGAAAALEKEVKGVREDADEAIARLKGRIGRMEAAQRDLNQCRKILWKQCKRLTVAKSTLQKRIMEKRKTQPATFKIMQRGQYTLQARSLARLLVSSGTAERKVGQALKEIGGILGIEVTKSISARSVQHFVLEEGVAADIQLVYEIIKSASKSNTQTMILL